MNKLNKKEMMNISGGATLTGSLVNAIWNGVKAFVDVGRNVGSSIRRLVSKNMC